MKTNQITNNLYVGDLDERLFTFYLSIKDELMQGGSLQWDKDLDWMIQDLAMSLNRKGDKAYIANACAAFQRERTFYYQRKIALLQVKK